MSAPIWKRPSPYVVLCAGALISFFVARGDLRVDGGAAKRERLARANPQVIRNQLAPTRPLERIVLVGRVLDALGFALSGAEIIGGDGVRAHTQNDGSFELSMAKTSFSDLLVRAKGYGTSLLRASHPAPGPLVVQLFPETPWDPNEAPARAAPPLLTGEGTVRDGAGAPVTGAYVTAAGSGLWSLTDDIGRYSLPLLDSTPTLLVHRPETDDQPAYAARSPQLDLGRSSGVVPLPELVAVGGSTIRGVLRDADGSPIVGAPVNVAGEGLSRLVESDTNGRFKIGGLVTGSYEITPLAWRGALGRAHVVELAGEFADCELSVEHTQATRLLICEESGSPVGRAYVAVVVDGARRTVTQADGAGWAELPLVSGDMDFEVRAEGGDDELSVRRLDSEQGRLVVALP